jgi:hypothetical protein
MTGKELAGKIKEKDRTITIIEYEGLLTIYKESYLPVTIPTGPISNPFRDEILKSLNITLP